MVPPARRQQREQFVAGVMGVFDNPEGFLPEQVGVEVLHGWQLCPGDTVYGAPVEGQDPLYGAPVEGQDPLYGAPVEGPDPLYGAPVESMLNLLSLQRNKSRCRAVLMVLV